MSLTVTEASPIVLLNSYLLRLQSVETTKISSKGQVVIPKSLRVAHHWETGQELVVVDVGDGILFKPKSPFKETSINEVASSLKFTGKTKSLDDMDSAIRKGVKNLHK